MGELLVKEKKIKLFWQWFLSIRNNFGSKFENSKLLDDLDERICGFGNLTWEVGTGISCSDNNALVISPGGDEKLLPLTRKIVGHSPECSGWEFYYAKQPKKWDKQFTIFDNDKLVNIDASGWDYVLLRFSDGTFDIIIKSPEVYKLNFDVQQLSAEIVLDSEMGEEKRLDLIKEIEIVDKYEAKYRGKETPISSLVNQLADLIGDAYIINSG